MKKILPLALCLAPSLAAFAQPLNPISPPGVFIADPEVRVMPDGLVYLYGSRDLTPSDYCSRIYDVMSTPDLVNWKLHPKSFTHPQTLYAPDCIHRNGTYYLYYCLAGGGDDEGVATSKSPSGPFVDAGKMEGMRGIDPSVFVDDDGQAYIYWGQGGRGAYGAKLTQDMTQIVPGSIKEKLLYHRNSKYSDDPAVRANAKTDDFWFNEGSSIRKRNGIYYFVYAQGGRHGRAHCACLAYATSKSPLGPFTYQGVIVDNFGSGPNLVNNHGCIAEIKGQWYVFYHRPTHGSASMRKTCVEPIKFNADGTIPEVEMTTQGIGGPINPCERMDAARACLMSGRVRVMYARSPSKVLYEYLAKIKPGDTATWRYFDFTGKNVTRFTCKTLGKNLAGKIEIHLDKADGPLIGTCEIAASPPEAESAIHTTAIQPVTGVHALVMKFVATTPDPKFPSLFDMEWFVFDGKQ